MRSLIIKPAAEDAINNVADWLASQYFPKTGMKHYDEVEEFLSKLCNIGSLVFPLCKNKRLAKRKFSCIIYKRKWVIAFKYTKNTLTVHEFIWGPKLK